MPTPRRFDHDEARQLHAAGETYSALARRYNVTPTAIMRVCDQNTAIRMTARLAKHQTSGTCPDCGAPTSFNKSARRLRGQNDTDGSNRCRSCAALKAATSVRPATLRCSACRLWLPDEDFSSSPKQRSRRGRKSQCRLCDTVARRDSRLRSRTPCLDCGTPCSGERCSSCANRRNGYLGHAARYGFVQQPERVA